MKPKDKVNEAQLAELYDFIAGVGKYEHFGAGMHTYPNSEDPNDRLKYEMCEELERRGKIRKHLVTEAATVWMPREVKK